mmetsp:Transcript_34311/g.45914  ORF Transcript_34311/g.45914 Transcript_34311/m.45914 type:complete len:612 (-) Transcript_34311:206-2041(-)
MKKGTRSTTISSTKIKNKNDDKVTVKQKRSSANSVRRNTRSGLRSCRSTSHNDASSPVRLKRIREDDEEGDEEVCVAINTRSRSKQTNISSAIKPKRRRFNTPKAVTPSPGPNLRPHVISVVKSYTHAPPSPSTSCSFDLEHTLPDGVYDIDTPSPCCRPLSTPAPLQHYCPCIHSIHHSHPATLTESYLTTYGKDYHEALLSSLSPPGPLCLFSSSTSTTPVLLLQEDPNMDYLHRQTHLTQKMRAILMDWLIELAEEYHLHPRTLHLGVALVDKTLACANQGGSSTSSLASSASHTSLETRETPVKTMDTPLQVAEIASDNNPNLKEVTTASPLSVGGESASTSTTTNTITTNATSTTNNTVTTTDSEVMGDDCIIKREMLQCVGCACMLIATKLEEVQTLTPDDFVYMSDQSYTRRQITHMEMSVCTALRFHLQCKTPFSFLERFLRASRISGVYERGHLMGNVIGMARNGSGGDVLEYLCLYLLELGMLVYDLVPRKPSLVAAAAVYLARATLGLKDCTFPMESSSPNTPSSCSMSAALPSLGYWTPTLRYYSGYDLPDLEDTVRRIHAMQYKIESSELKSVYSKYKVEKYGRVSLLTCLNDDDLGF